MAILKRAFRYSMKPSGLLILGMGATIASIWPKLPETIAVALVKSGLGSNFITKNWELFSFDVDEAVVEMQNKVMTK